MSQLNRSRNQNRYSLYTHPKNSTTVFSFKPASEQITPLRSLRHPKQTTLPPHQFPFPPPQTLSAAFPDGAGPVIVLRTTVVALPVVIVPVAGGRVLPGASSVALELTRLFNVLVGVVVDEDASAVDIDVDLDDAVVVFRELEGRIVCVESAIEVVCKCVKLCVLPTMEVSIVTGAVGAPEKQDVSGWRERMGWY